MAIGIPVSVTDINNTIGNAGRDFFALYTRAKTISQRLKLYSDADLAAIGFATADVTAVRQFEQFADTLCALFDGTAALPTPTNFLEQVSGIIGVGL